GAGDMAFPFLNGLAFWSAVPAGTVMLTGFFLAGGAAAAGWTVYPPLSAIPLNPGTNMSFLGDLLRIKYSTWPMTPVVMNYIAFFLFIAYMCAYYIHLGHKALNAVGSIIIAALGAVVCVRMVQYWCYDGQSCWFFSLFWLGFSSLMGAVNYLTTIIK